MTTMDCRTAKKDIDAYLDGELGDQECKDFMDHVDDCADCRDKFRSSKKSINLLQLVYNDSVPPTKLRENIFGKLGQTD